MNTTFELNVINNEKKIYTIKLSLSLIAIASLLVLFAAAVFYSALIATTWAATNSISQSNRAETARLSGQAEFYAGRRPERAEIARWRGLEQLYEKSVKSEQVEIARLDSWARFYLAAKNAEIARWNGLVQLYAKNIRAKEVVTARLNGLAEYYGVETSVGLRVELAESGRWNGLADAYLAAKNAEIARLKGLAESYQVETGTGQQAQAAEIARWNGLAEDARIQSEARQRASRVSIDRLTGLAVTYAAEK